MLMSSRLQATAEVLKRFKTAPARLELAISDRLSVRISILDTVLVPFATSLTSLVLCRIPASQIQALPSGLFSSLERLVLHIAWKEHETGMFNEPIVAFESAPVLQRVATNNLMLSQAGAITLRLPWHQLTHFMEADHGEHSHRFLAEIFPQCVALQWLHIGVSDECIGQHFGGPQEIAVTRTVQNLQSLTLDFFESLDASLKYPDFFDATDFPGLRSLRLIGFEMYLEDEFTWNPDQVDRFLYKLEHEFRLEYLSLCHNPSRISLERLFKATPHVTTLDAHIYRNYEGFFETLTLGQDNPLLPRLQTLVLELGLSEALVESKGIETIDPDIFADFLESRMRCDSANRLRKIKLYGGDWEQISDEVPFVQVIQRYLSEGLLLERCAVTEIRQRDTDQDWIERAPELQDWLEARVAFDHTSS
ncbi:hypothetical protein MD484_g3340, partial [Candolleomyces efflorescens]